MTKYTNSKMKIIMEWEMYYTYKLDDVEDWRRIRRGEEED